MDVLDLVFSSTCLIITAQYNEGQMNYFCQVGTRDNDRVRWNFSVSDFSSFSSTIFVDWPMYIPILNTEPSPTITPSTTSDIAPKKTLSSIIVGNA